VAAASRRSRSPRALRRPDATPPEGHRSPAAPGAARVVRERGRAAPAGRRARDDRGAGCRDPIVIRFGDLRLIEDLCHSVEERASILEGLGDRPLRSILELGAGYGRVAYVLLQAHPRVRYTIVDIPPALYVSQRYLTDVLPERRVFRLRPFADHAAVADEMTAADLVFLEPQQLELLPERSFDLGITISTLHEMRPEQIAQYVRQLDRLCDSVYTKQWRRFHNRRDGVVISASDYPIPERWRPVFHRSPIFPRTFFEALYLVR
jgi:SAM-dependent methyltransferase